MAVMRQLTLTAWLVLGPCLGQLQQVEALIELSFRLSPLPVFRSNCFVAAALPQPATHGLRAAVLCRPGHAALPHLVDLPATGHLVDERRYLFENGHALPGISVSSCLRDAGCSAAATARRVAGNDFLGIALRRAVVRAHKPPTSTWSPTDCLA